MAERRRLVLLAGLTLASIALFMTMNLRGDPIFALQLRGVRLLVLLEVAVAMAVATVLFQTVTGNVILTPSVMGIDALFVMLQTGIVFVLGTLGLAALGPWSKFAGETLLLTAFTLAVFLPLLKARIDLTRILLVGVVLGFLFRSLSALLARMIDPNDFAVVQGTRFADFTSVRADLALVALLPFAVVIACAWRWQHALDILALGRDAATGLGVDWTRTVSGVIVLVAVLVAVSTALVGPIAFLGLLAVALAERVIGTRRHGPLMLGAALTAMVLLVGGQALFQHGLGGASVLAVVIEFAGGLVFLMLLLKGTRR
ncbi:iron chelate uptake ABC transporter family permease subunit [Aurantimonas endophytica]|uniref:Iron complex transport system permease protein n=1 Tax=Aurantimonas endophytica TaxID=1522175 RepID=A0A7W6H9S9_9HYPH|nr:iron chelate uptake ABC transporter family permease subunit [Aurantimonas endophytica]MBB4001211.1 iron complex transport system permease protein [Aurantimonas endophytica]MCO6403139.1 iron chelate uptake ABC transporter family permease subunit [Aurantimonas endophytica]